MESVLKRRRKKGYGGKYLRKREEARSEKREGVMDAERLRVTVSECCLIKLLPYILSEKIYLYFSIGNGQPREPALCQLLVPYVYATDGTSVTAASATFVDRCVDVDFLSAIVRRHICLNGLIRIVLSAESDTKLHPSTHAQPAILCTA